MHAWLITSTDACLQMLHCSFAPFYSKGHGETHGSHHCRPVFIVDMAWEMLLNVKCWSGSLESAIWAGSQAKRGEAIASASFCFGKHRLSKAEALAQCPCWLQGWGGVWICAACTLPQSLKVEHFCRIHSFLILCRQIGVSADRVLLSERTNLQQCLQSGDLKGWVQAQQRQRGCLKGGVWGLGPAPDLLDISVCM